MSGLVLVAHTQRAGRGNFVPNSRMGSVEEARNRKAQVSAFETCRLCVCNVFMLHVERLAALEGTKEKADL